MSVQELHPGVESEVLRGEERGEFSPHTIQEVAPFIAAGSIDNVLPVRGGYSGCSLADLITRIKAGYLKKRLVRSIIRAPTEELATAVSTQLGNFFARNRDCTAITLCFWAVHHGATLPHIHVWHDCHYSGSYCRCAIFNPYRAEGFSQQGTFIVNSKTSLPGWGSGGRGYRPPTPLHTELLKKTENGFIRNMFE